ncbi:MAG: hypothetical protein HUU01_22715, partial [Saprospiraceae bacterium]|nr:hypothetical protein [Saprospiraceae bacterium]
MRLLLLFLLSGFAAQAQKDAFLRHFTEKDGLSDNNVQCLLRDRQGFLWVGTTYGLNRYDGYVFRQYLPDARQPEKTVCHEIINDLEQDDAGYIWVATRNGLNRYDPRTEIFKTWKNIGREDGSLPNSLVTDLLCDKDNQIWLCCDNRDLTLFDAAHFTFTMFPWKAFTEKALPEYSRNDYKTIYRLDRKSEHELWLFSNLGTFSFHTRTRLFTFHQGLKVHPELPENIVHKDLSGLTWLGAQDGLRCFDPNLQHFRFKPVTGQTETGTYPFYRFIEVDDGRQYATNLEGRQLFIFERGKIIQTLTLPGNCALLFQDRLHRIWVGAGSQLFFLNPKTQNLNRVNIPAHLPQPGTTSTFQDMAEDSKGNLWFATDEAGIWVWQTAKNTWWKPAEAEGFIGRNISCVFADRQRQSLRRRGGHRRDGRSDAGRAG